MEEVNKLLNQFLNEYPFKRKNPKDMFNYFVQHVYFTLENKINKEKKYKNKYIKIRKQLLQLIFVNHHKIKASIRQSIK